MITLAGATRPAPRPAGHAAAGVKDTATHQITTTGIVQGVGFRPYVHRLAIRHGVAGWVRNEAGVVRIIAQSSTAHLNEFESALRRELPPLARLDSVDVVEIESSPLRGFRVVASDTRPVGRLPISPDVALCDSCEAEMNDPTNRRYQYPFITCTDCGPRFTVVESMPYDRERSTMKAFEQCPECLREYGDPQDRRYHSETNSCPACGPSVTFEAPDLEDMCQGEDAIAEAGRRLRTGQVLAVRGLGGFHLAADAGDEQAVLRLRRRKGRDAKPLAVMVSSPAAAGELALVSPVEAELLGSRERPIVVLRKRPDSGLAESIAPDLDSVGVMVAYTPLHHLLLDAVDGRPLVMTSGNRSDEPIATGNAEAKATLAHVADAFLLHDRDIVARYDDSLVRVVDDRAVFLRRSRGYAPMPLRLPVPSRDGIVAFGPHLKNTFTLAQGSDAYVSQHIGDLENIETIDHFQESRARFEAVFRIEPRWAVRDLHPGYLSTRLAEESGLEPLAPVQHHHAHVAAVLGEHGVKERALGLSFDGTGYGTDGHVWGFEFLAADLVGFERLAHLRYVPLPGGDRAARFPWRSLLGYASLDPDGDWASRALAGVPPVELTLARRQIERSINTPYASSMGRLFDAAAAVLGLRLRCAYEGHAAMELEALAGDVSAEPLPFPLMSTNGPAAILDPIPLLAAVADARHRGMPLDEAAAAFHESLAAAVTALAIDLCANHSLHRVALSGGCFQNARLMSSVAQRLRRGGLQVLVPAVLSPNDGAVSYGQAVVAAARLVH